jgi:hypothetical protein
MLKWYIKGKQCFKQVYIKEIFAQNKRKQVEYREENRDKTIYNY